MTDIEYFEGTVFEVEAILPAPLPLMGVKVTPFRDYLHATETVKHLIDSKQKAFSAAINPEKIYLSKSDMRVRNLLNQAEICICDGIGAALAVRILYGKSIGRITGVALFYELIRASAQNNWKVFLLGASPETNVGAYQKLLNDNPSLQIVGRQDGYFKDTDEVVKKINDSGADLLFVAMGSPKQEIWIAENRDRINAPFCMGVGGTFDVVNGSVKWAPAFYRKTGTEWLYRLVSEPKRWRRQLVLPKFVWLLFRYRLGLEGK
jgi:N-acetylglucosaminyldiphosphoundecaprenol N-acetyl-beta-D-mannosaminyltransferase